MTLPEDRNCETDWRKKLFLSDEFSDCEIIVQSPEYTSTRFPCHKVILSAASDVFERMLQHAFQEGLNGKIIIDDNTTPSVMMILLKFIYLDCVHLEEWTVARDVLRVAFKYKILSLLQICETFLNENVTLSNVCHILQSAIMCDLKGLRIFCLNICDRACFVVLNTRAFQESSQATLKCILSMPSIQVENEMMVYKAVWKWATYRCCVSNRHVTNENIAMEMLPLLDCIGFKFMSDNDINSIPNAAMNVFCKTVPETSTNGEEESKPEESKPKDPNNLTENKINKLNLSIHSAILEERQMNFPIDLPYYRIGINLKSISHSLDACSNGSGTLLRFSVASHAYLQGLILCCLKESYSQDEMSSLHISSRKGTLIAFNNLDKDGESVYFPSKGNNNFTRLYFYANRLALIEAGEEYSVEVNGNTQSNINWPLMTLEQDHGAKRARFNVLSKKTYGLYQIDLIQAF